MVDNKAPRAYVNMLAKTKAELTALKHPGQSYDGVLQELLSFWQRGHGVEAAVETKAERAKVLV